MTTAGFDDKLFARLAKLDANQLQAYVGGLLGQRQFMRSVFDALDEGLIVTSPGLALLFVNRRARQMLALPRDRALTGENLLDRLPTDHPLRGAFQQLAKLIRTDEPIESVYGRRADRRVAITMQPIADSPRDTGDEVEENLPRLVLLRDITERRRRQSEQARARRLASLATLTGGIAHEIKNPLNSLNIHAQLLQSEIEDAGRSGKPLHAGKVERAAGVIMEETQRLGRIIEDFLQAARPRSPRLEPTELRGMLERAERLFCPDCERHGIAFNVSVDPDIPPLLIDEHLLFQALRNLVRNAIEAVGDKAEQQREAGEPYTPWIRLIAEIAGDAVHLIVADNGPGIASADMEHIFEPYYTTKFNGTGLGLMVVYRIVTEHRGALHVDSHPGEGVRFVISLPLQQRPVRLLGHEPASAPVVIPRKPAD